jgi:Ser/Thr protein kinase RdoA (MazF antagonist)
MELLAAPPSADEIAAAFGLGTPAAPLRAASGGESHRVWRLQTTAGVFAVKELNRPHGNAGWVPWIERAFRFEQAAFAAGIVMPRPVPVASTGLCLAELPGAGEQPVTVRVHAWVEGTKVEGRGHAPEDARAVGAMLARIHALAVPAVAPPAELMRTYGATHWRALVERTSAADVAWAPELACCLSAIDELETFVASARADAPVQVMGHRDAAPRNVLRTPDRSLVLIDWDSAGPEIPQQEAARALIEWSQVGDTTLDAALARALIDGYRAAGGVLGRRTRGDFAGFISKELVWLEFNVRRALGERLQGASDRELGDRKARDMLARVPRFVPLIDSAAELLCAP